MDRIKTVNFWSICFVIILMSWLYFACVVWAIPTGGLALHFAVDNVPVEGVGFCCYRVDETVDAAGAGELKELAETLSRKIEKERPAPDGKGVTDENGKLEFIGLGSGVYLVVGEDIEIDGSMIRPQSFLAYSAEEMSQTAEVKYEKTMITQKPDGPGEKLPQTGVLWGGISALLCAGFFFVLAGKWMQRSDEKDRSADEK